MFYRISTIHRPARRGSSTATLVVAAIIALIPTFFVGQALYRLREKHDGTKQISQLSDPATATYGADYPEKRAGDESPKSDTAKPSPPSKKTIESLKPSVDEGDVIANTESPKEDAAQDDPDDPVVVDDAAPSGPVLGSPADGGLGDPTENSLLKDGDLEDRPSMNLTLKPATPPDDAHAIRDWTAIDGARAEASFVERNGDIVTLRDTTGRDFQIPLSRLSRDDVDWIQSLE